MGNYHSFSVERVDGQATRGYARSSMAAREHGRFPCGTNLEQGGQDARLRLGVAMLAIALLGTVGLVQADLHRAWRLLLFLPFFMAAFGAWQGLFRTCPGLAFKGLRETATGHEAKVKRKAELVAAQRAARQVLIGAIATALVSTSVVFFLP